MFDMLKQGVVAAQLSPLTSLRYMLFALLVMGSLVLGFHTFRRMSLRGIDAFGRNPLAGKPIKRLLLLNFFLTVFIIAAGLLIAYFVLIL